MIKHTTDIDESFFIRLRTVAAELEADPLHLLSVWYAESNVRAGAHNANGHASGIFQAMPATLMGLGWSTGHAAYRQLSATEQLEWALRYYRPHRGRLVSIGAVYTATFLPALLKHAGEPEFVLCARGGRLGWAYEANAVFDANKDLRITVSELQQAVERNCRGARWAELVERQSGARQPALCDSEYFDLGSVRGVQEALSRLGFDTGPIDGHVGPLTAAAVREFQLSRALRVDGIYGPLTRAALATALATAQ